MRYRVALMAPFVIVLCVGCGGGGGPGTDPLPAAPPAANPPSSSPPPSSPPPSNPPPSSPPPTFTLGGTVTGLRGSGLTLQNGDTRLPVASDGPFAFPDALASGTSYSVAVQSQPANPPQICTVTNGGGVIAAVNVTSITISCAIPEANRSWQVATQVHQYDALAEAGVQVAVNAHGIAALLWRERTVSDNVVRIWASRYTPESKQWSAPISLGPQGGTDDLSAEAAPHVAIADSGETLAVWPQLVNGTYEIWASRYTGSAAWSAPVRIDTAAGTAGYSQVVYDAVGNATVVWQQLEGTLYHLYFSRLSVGAMTWSAPVQLDATAGSAGTPRLAADAHGNVVALWVQSDSAQAGPLFHVWSSIYRSVSGAWSAPESMISNDPTLSAFFPQVVANAAGVAEAMWVQTDNSIWSNHYTPTSGWGTPQLVEAGGNGNDFPVMAIDQDGNVLAAWARSDLNVPQSAHMRYATLPSGGHWSASAPISATDAGTSEFTEAPQIAFDAQGDALATWSRISGGQANTRSAVYTPGTGWSAPVGVDDGSEADDGAVLAVAPNGTAIAAWRQFANSVSTILAAFFD